MIPTSLPGDSDRRAKPGQVLRLLEDDNDLKEVPGARFVMAYSAVKHEEFEAFHKIISSREREYLLLNV